MSGSSAENTVFTVRPTPVMKVVPFIVMVPVILVAVVSNAPVAQLVVVVILLFAIWASVGARLTVGVGKETVDVAGTFYRRSIPLGLIETVTVVPDDGMNHGLLNWPVTGLAISPEGVRLNLGGHAALRIATTTGERYTVVFATNAGALACRDRVAAAKNGDGV